MDADGLCYCLYEALVFALKKPTHGDKFALCGLASVRPVKIASDTADRMGPKLYEGIFFVAFLSSRLKSKASDVDRLEGNIPSKGIYYQNACKLTVLPSSRI